MKNKFFKLNAFGNNYCSNGGFMELIERLLDEANEKILDKLDDAIGLSNNKSVLRNIIQYSQVMKKHNCNVEFENYNIVIRNESSYNLYEQLINVIAEIYYKNRIILNEGIYYANREQVRKLISGEEKIEEGIIVINYADNRNSSDTRKIVEQITEKMPTKAIMILEDHFCEGEVNAILNEYVTWSMKIESISQDEKEKYIRNFMEINHLTCSESIVNELSNNPYYKIKNELINILVNCKNSNEKNVSNILKDKRKEVKQKVAKKTGMEELDNLIGMEDVKKQLKKVINYIKISKDRTNMPMLHMCFNGNPGTGKTTVARIVGKIFSEEKILSDKRTFIEAQRSDLIAKYVGHTAPQTQRFIDRAKGGVLFIDEAYSIASYIQDEAGRDFGAECIATLLKGMEDNRDNLCVILAGYTKEMKHMLSVNPGFESRIQFTIEFPDYSSEELYEIFRQLCKKEEYKMSSNIKSILIEHFEDAKKQKNFSNARYVRSFFEKVKIDHANRVLEENDGNRSLIKKCDIEGVITKIQPKDIEKSKIKIGFGG